MPALLRPAPSGPAERLASRVAGWPPAAVFVLALVAGFVAYAVLLALVGSLVTDVVLDVGWVRRADEGIIDALVAARAPALTDVSTVLSGIGGGPVLASLAGLIVVVAATRRNWLIAAFVACLLPDRDGAVPPDVEPGPAHAPRRRSTRGSPVRRQLPLRPHGRVPRGVCGPHAAAGVRHPAPTRRGGGVDGGDRPSDPRRRVPDVPRDAPPVRRRRRRARRPRARSPSWSSPVAPRKPPRASVPFGLSRALRASLLSVRVANRSGSGWSTIAGRHGPEPACTALRRAAQQAPRRLSAHRFRRPFPTSEDQAKAHRQPRGSHETVARLLAECLPWSTPGARSHA